MIEPDSSNAFTFFMRGIGADGLIRAVGRTSEAAGAAFDAAVNAEVAGMDVTAAYTVEVRVDHAHARECVLSLFEDMHGTEAAEVAWQSVRVEAEAA